MTLTFTYYLDLQSSVNHGHDLLTCKSSRSTDCITSPANAVGKNSLYPFFLFFLQIANNECKMLRLNIEVALNISKQKILTTVEQIKCKQRQMNC